MSILFAKDGRFFLISALSVSVSAQGFVPPAIAQAQLSLPSAGSGLKSTPCKVTVDQIPTAKLGTSVALPAPGATGPVRFHGVPGQSCGPVTTNASAFEHAAGNAMGSFIRWGVLPVQKGALGNAPASSNLPHAVTTQMLLNPQLNKALGPRAWMAGTPQVSQRRYPSPFPVRLLYPMLKSIAVRLGPLFPRPQGFVGPDGRPAIVDANGLPVDVDIKSINIQPPERVDEIVPPLLRRAIP